MTTRTAPAAQATDTDPALSGIGLIRIDHVGLAVTDLDEAVERYERTFGMRCVGREENIEQGVREAMMRVGTDPDGGCFQLLAPLTPDSQIARFLSRSGPGVQQVACLVQDIETAEATLRSRGVRLLYDSPRHGTAGSRINFVHPKDTGGILLELVEQAPPA